MKLYIGLDETVLFELEHLHTMCCTLWWVHCICMYFYVHCSVTTQNHLTSSSALDANIRRGEGGEYSYLQKTTEDGEKSSIVILCLMLCAFIHLPIRTNTIIQDSPLRFLSLENVFI